MVEITEEQYIEYLQLKTLFTDKKNYHTNYYHDKNINDKVRFCSDCNHDVKYLSWCYHVKSKKHLKNKNNIE